MKRQFNYGLRQLQSGKSNILLDDKSAVAKSRNQLEQLQERSEQLETMLVWQENLRALI